MMDRPKQALKGLPGTTMRRLRNTPSYFLLVWRWGTWLYALTVILVFRSNHMDVGITLLIITFVQTLLVTLYAPIFQVLLPNLPRIPRFRLPQTRSRSLLHAEDEEPDTLTPLGRTRNIYWDSMIYGADVIICGIVMYYGGMLNVSPPFGAGSPFYRYGMAAALSAALAYRYKGGLLAAFIYDLFAILGMIVPVPGIPAYTPNVIDIVGSLIDTPLAALLAAYLATLIASNAQSKRREQDDARTQRSLVRVGETLLRGATNRQQLLQQSVAQIRQGGHFQRLVIALPTNLTDEEDNEHSQAEITSCVEAEVSDEVLPNVSEHYIKQVMQSKQQYSSFEPLKGHAGYGIARLYVPLFKEGHMQLVLGAESRRQTPFNQKREEFLKIAGAELLVALENIRLTEQTIQLAATAERSRIAREIHDGVAQLIYMLSLNTETSATQAHRIAEASEEDAELITPLAERLDKLVTISKQALWETRNYMFALKPLMSGTTTLTQMLTNQLREFEAISGLSTQLEVEGNEELQIEDQRRTRRYAEVGTAIFRITQEALTNAYKHAEATQIKVYLHYLEHSVEVEICDNGRGLQTTPDSYDLASAGGSQRIYSGHGIRGMRERVTELDGSFELLSLPAGGVKVQVHIPV